MSDLRELLDFDLQVLRMLNGETELPWGAAVSVSLEWLSGNGYASATLPYRITDKGRALLKSELSKGDR